MFSTASETRYTADTGKDPTLKNCQLCFSEYEEVNGLGYNPKLPDLCFKYLHSSLTQELPSGSADQPFCARCYGSAMELVTFSEEMDFIQKSMSDLVFMFSLEILHRRRQTSESTETLGKHLIEFDVSALPNCDAWKKPTTVIITHISSLPQQIKSENISIENEVHAPDFTENNVRNVDLDSEINNGNLVENNSEMWIEERAILNEHATVTSNSPYAANSALLIEHKVLTNSEAEASTSACVTTRLCSPIIHLAKLQNCGETQVTDDKNPLRERAKRVGTESYSVNIRRSVRQRSANEQWGGKLESPPLSPVPTSGSSNSSKSTSPLRKRLRSQNVSKAKGYQTKRKTHHENLYKKSVKPQCKTITDKKSHNEEEKYQCIFCPEYFNSSILLSKHHRQHRKKQTQLKCTYCPKVFSGTTDWVRHIRTHTGEKPFRCEKCDYTSARLSQLNSHKERRHCRHAASFNCRKCGNKFKFQDDVRAHYKRVHADLEYSKDCVIVGD